MSVPWTCPVCGEGLDETDRALRCQLGHSFDVAATGHVNLLTAGQRRSRQPGDSKEMIVARRRFLATGAYDRVSDAVGHVVHRAVTAAAERWGGARVLVLDVGCGEGHHTRRVAAAAGEEAAEGHPVALQISGIDVSKPAVALAARAHPSGRYAVASAAAIPLPAASVDVAMNIFGPVLADELARVVRPGGTAVIAHPGREHLDALRRLVYADSRPHDPKDPLRHARQRFARVGTVNVTFPVRLRHRSLAEDLFTMTPYRWHAPADIVRRLDDAVTQPGGFTTVADVIVSSYRRLDDPEPYTCPS